MNHGTLAIAQSTSVPPSGLDTNRPMQKAIDVIFNVKRIDTSGSRELINGRGNHVGVPRVASLFPKSLGRRT
jgi:hypothetical protein